MKNLMNAPALSLAAFGGTVAVSAVTGVPAMADPGWSNC